MNLLKKLSLIFAAGTLGACSSTSTPTTPFVPLVSGVATANAGGTYTVTQSGATTTLPVPDTNLVTTALGLSFWDLLGADRGFVHDSADVTAIAIMKNGTNATVVGLSGTAAASVPTSGTATYTGGFSASYLRGGLVNGPWVARGDMTTNVDFGAGTLTGSGAGSFNSTLSVYGTISGTNFNGLAALSALDYEGPAGASLSGGFYGTNTLAGVYQNANVAGLIWGDKP